MEGVDLPLQLSLSFPWPLVTHSLSLNYHFPPTPDLCYLLPPPPPPFFPFAHNSSPLLITSPPRGGPEVRTSFCYSGWTPQWAWFAYKSDARLLRPCPPPLTIPPLSPSPSHLPPPHHSSCNGNEYYYTQRTLLIIRMLQPLKIWIQTHFGISDDSSRKITKKLLHGMHHLE